MPSTQDYTLIQFMRGGKYAIETITPQSGEPLLDIDSGTLYVGNGTDARGIPLNTVTSVQLEAPVNLDNQVTWGRYYIEGKVIGLPDGVELFGKFFLTVQGSTATEAKTIWQQLDILSGDFQDRSFIRSSLDSGSSWTTWKGNTGGLIHFDQNGFGTKEKNPTASLDKYVLPSQNFIESIIGGPEDSDGYSGFLFVYRKNSISPYIFQQLVILNSPKNTGKVYCRFSATENKDWNSPGYTWREITAVTASKTERGTVKIGENINIDGETISVNTGSTTKRGLVQVGSNINVSQNGTISVSTATATEKGVVKTGHNISNTEGNISVLDGTTGQKGVVQLSNSITSESEETAATSKAISDSLKIRDIMYVPVKPKTIPPELKNDGLLIIKNDDGVTPSQVYPSATGVSKGIVQIGNNLTINDGIVSVDDGTLYQKGLVQLSSATNDTRETLAATTKAVKITYDLANTANIKASTAASTSKAGVVQLSSATNSTSETLAATAKAVKTTYDIAHRADVKEFVQYSTTTITKVPNNLVNNGIVIVETADGTTQTEVYPSATGASKGIVQIGTNLSVSNGVVSVASASTSAKGVVQLTSVTNSTSETLAATAKALKTTYDIAHRADVKEFVQYSATAVTKVPTNLVDNGIVIVDVADGTTQTEVYPSATGASKGIVQIGSNLSVSNGVVSVATGSTSTAGVVKLSDSTSSSSSTEAATSKAVKSTYDLAAKADAKKFVVYTSSVPSSVPSGLVEGGIIIVG